MANYPMLWLIAKDYREQLFSIEGQNWDDRAFTKNIADLKDKGIPVACETPKVSDYPNKEDLIKVFNEINYKYNETSVLDKYR